MAKKNLPVLVEPVVNLGLGIKWVAKVGWARRSHPVHWSVGSEEVVSELLVLALIILLEDSKVA